MSPYSFPGPGPLARIDAVLLSWFAPTAISVASIACDVLAETRAKIAIKRTRVPSALCGTADKEPRPCEHEASTGPVRKQALGAP